MRAWAVVLLLSGAAAAQQAAQASSPFGAAAEARFARLALECVHKEYPNKIAHVLNSDAEWQELFLAVSVIQVGVVLGAGNTSPVFDAGIARRGDDAPGFGRQG